MYKCVLYLPLSRQKIFKCKKRKGKDRQVNSGKNPAGVGSTKCSGGDRESGWCSG